MRPSRRSRRDVAGLWPYHAKRQHDALKRESQQAVARAIATGELKRQPCTKCGTVRRVEAHHEDYGKPLDVVWLCRFHHRLRHWELRAEANEVARQVRADVRAIGSRRRYLSHLNSNQAVPAVIRAVSISIADVMEREGVNESDLAERLGCSRQSINAGFAGGFRTLKSIAAIGDALGYDVSLVLTKRRDSCDASTKDVA